MEIKLLRTSYILGNKEIEIDWGKIKYLVGKNNSGKSLLISLLLISLGSSYERDNFFDINNNSKNQLNKVVVKTDFTISAQNNIQKINVVASWMKQQKKFQYEISINSEKHGNIDSTKELSKIIFEKIGMPTNLVWSNSAACMLMDDIWRFTFVSQRNINYRIKLKDTLPARNATTIRNVVVSTYLMDPEHQLIKLLIESSKLVNDSEAIRGLKKLTRAFPKINVNTFEASDQELEKMFKRRSEITKEMSVLRKERNFYASVQQSNYLQKVVVSYLERVDKIIDTPIDVVKYIRNNLSAIQLRELDLSNQKIIDIDQGLTLLHKEKKDLVNRINHKVSCINEKDKMSIAYQFIKTSHLDKTPESLEIQKIKKYYEENYLSLKNKYSNAINFQSDWSNNNNFFIWGSNGGAITLIDNIKRIMHNAIVNKENWSNILPIIIDGALAEDFDKNHDPSLEGSWFSEVKNYSGQKIIAIAENHAKLINNKEEIFFTEDILKK